MARGKPFDVRAEAYRLADLHLQRQGVTKAAGSDRMREELAVTLYAPVVEAVHSALGTGPRIGLSGELITKEAAGESAVSKALRKNRKAARRLGKSFRRFEESERRRREAEAAQQAAMAEKIAGRPARPQFRELSGADLARLRMIMTTIASAEGQFIDGLQQDAGGAPVNGGGA